MDMLGHRLFSLSILSKKEIEVFKKGEKSYLKNYGLIYKVPIFVRVFHSLVLSDFSLYLTV